MDLDIPFIFCSEYCLNFRARKRRCYTWRCLKTNYREQPLIYMGSRMTIPRYRRYGLWMQEVCHMPKACGYLQWEWNLVMLKFHRSFVITEIIPYCCYLNDHLFKGAITLLSSWAKKMVTPGFATPLDFRELWILSVDIYLCHIMVKQCNFLFASHTWSDGTARANLQYLSHSH